MIQSIIVQAEKAYLATISEMVKQESQEIKIIPVDNLADLIAIPFSTLENSRLISFSSANIVPAKILNLLGHGAYNFHPGPPSRPGWGAIEKAIYDQDNAFGTTLHAMNEYIDCGSIIALNFFPIPPNCTREDLINLTFRHLLKLFVEHIKELIQSQNDLIALPVEWGAKKFTKADYSAYCIISENIAKEELELRVRAFKAANRPPIRFAKNGCVFALTDEIPSATASQNIIKLHGYNFAAL